MKKLSLFLVVIIVLSTIVNVPVFADQTLVQLTDNYVNVRTGAGTNYPSIGKVNSGSTYAYLGEGKDLQGKTWYKMQYGSKQGFVISTYSKLVTVSTAPSTGTSTGKLIVTAVPRLNVRSAPSITSTILGKLNTGVTVEYYSLSGGWYKINFGGKVAYISASYAKVSVPVGTAPTTPTPPSAPTPPATPTTPTYAGKLVTTASTYLNVRSMPTTSSTIIGKLPLGTQVNYYSLASGWYKIDYNGKVAYISASYGKAINTTPTAPTPAPTVVGKINITAIPSLNVRSQPSTSSTILGKLLPGAQVEYYSVANGWYKINYNGKIAYVSAEYATPVVPVPVPESLKNLPVQIDAATYQKYLETAKTKFVKYGSIIDPTSITPIVITNITTTTVINKFFALPDDYVPADLTNIKPFSSGYRLRKEAADAWNRLYDAAAAKGISLVVNSAYRTKATQSTMFFPSYASNVSYTSGWAAYPRRSEHEMGLAVDISLMGSSTSTFYTTTRGKFLSDNAHKYGFILRYMQGREPITNYSYEPWHYRYVGVELATYLKQTGLTMEEFFKLMPY